MRVRSVVLALLLASSFVVAADAHPKTGKFPKHAIHTPKTANHSKDAKKAVIHKSPKVAQRRTSTPKVAKHKPAKYQKHRA